MWHYHFFTCSGRNPPDFSFLYLQTTANPSWPTSKMSLLTSFWGLHSMHPCLLPGLLWLPVNRSPCFHICNPFSTQLSEGSFILLEFSTFQWFFFVFRMEARSIIGPEEPKWLDAVMSRTSAPAPHPYCLPGAGHLGLLSAFQMHPSLWAYGSFYLLFSTWNAVPLAGTYILQMRKLDFFNLWS